MLDERQTLSSREATVSTVNPTHSRTLPTTRAHHCRDNKYIIHEDDRAELKWIQKAARHKEFLQVSCACCRT